MAILIVGALYVPLLWSMAFSTVWLAVLVGRRARCCSIRISHSAAVELAGLLLLKSAAMTAGRWWGSVKYGAPCL